MTGNAMRYLEPDTIEQAVELLTGSEDARCIAGGQTLVAMMNANLIEPEALVSLQKISELQTTTLHDDGRLSVGAMVTHSRIERDDRLSHNLAVVREAAAVTAHPAVRNRGTIGGTICHADAAADQPTAVIAADAEIEIAGPNGRRIVPAADFFLDYLTTALEEGELVVAIHFPPAVPGSIGVYEKFGRVDGDFGIITVAVVLEADAQSVARCRIVLGGCGMTPIRVRAAEEILERQGLGDDAVAQASAELVAACDPVDDVRGTAAYRLELVPIILKRAIARAVLQLEQGQ